MPFYIIRQDIVLMDCDAIVNAANESLKRGGGVCGAIFEAAGIAELEEECDKIGGCKPGNSVITKGYNSRSKYIIHTVGPVYNGGHSGERQTLESCYTSALELAESYHLQSVAFPLISAGIYGYPKQEAYEIAKTTIRKFIEHSEMRVFLVLFDTVDMTFTSSSAGMANFISDSYVQKKQLRFENSRFDRFVRNNIRANNNINPVVCGGSMAPFEDCRNAAPLQSPRHLDNVVKNVGESFSRMLLRLIDEKGFSDVETYKKANCDRKLFSKIRSDNGYRPSKYTAVAFAVSLELNLDETLDLLETAGYTLSHSSVCDLIIEYFISNGIYDIFEINEALFSYEQKTLGA